MLADPVTITYPIGCSYLIPIGRGFESFEILSPRMVRYMTKRRRGRLSYPFSKGIELISCASRHLVSENLRFGFLNLRFRQSSICQKPSRPCIGLEKYTR